MMKKSNINQIFDKYILIWIWSIFITINTTLSYNIFTYYNGSKWGKLSVVTIPFVVIAAMLALMSWSFLFNFFRIKILDLILPSIKSDKFESEAKIKELKYHLKRLKRLNITQEYEENIAQLNYEIDKIKQSIYLVDYELNDRAYKYLQNSFKFIIYAVATRFAMSIIEAMFSSFYSSILP